MNKEQKIVKEAQLRELMLSECSNCNTNCKAGRDCVTCREFLSKKRVEILKDYKVGERGIIRSPGKFEGERLYVPYFWERYVEGFADRDDGKYLGFDITPEERRMFPELGTRKRTVKLYQEESGFVCELNTYPS